MPKHNPQRPNPIVWDKTNVPKAVTLEEAKEQAADTQQRLQAMADRVAARRKEKKEPKHGKA